MKGKSLTKILYRKARKNYLARVRRLEKKGYNVKRIPIPKRITQGSIRRLKSQTTARLKRTFPLLSSFLGKEVEFQPYHEKKLEWAKQKREFVKALFTDEGAESSSKKLPKYKIILEVWGSYVDTLHPEVKDYVRMRADQLIHESPIKFANAFSKQPNIFPTPADSRLNIVNFKMNQVAELIGANSWDLGEVIEFLGGVYE